MVIECNENKWARGDRIVSGQIDHDKLVLLPVSNVIFA